VLLQLAPFFFRDKATYNPFAKFILGIHFFDKPINHVMCPFAVLLIFCFQAGLYQPPTKLMFKGLHGFAWLTAGGAN